jgi:hypothetical protein
MVFHHTPAEQFTAAIALYNKACEAEKEYEEKKIEHESDDREFYGHLKHPYKGDCSFQQNKINAEAQIRALAGSGYEPAQQWLAARRSKGPDCAIM